MTDPACAPDTRFATKQVQAAYVAGKPQNTAVPPIYQSAAYEFANLAEARDLFA
ncbi:MAG: O-acetylhomoserine aminocarboxypropyltransferase, partial [Actinobacteria bacterium]|nr:O-acetylhomoserine aminocarboxypropyltransferase [Actinomycetota bacterium]